MRTKCDLQKFLLIHVGIMNTKNLRQLLKWLRKNFQKSFSKKYLRNCKLLNLGTM